MLQSLYHTSFSMNISDNINTLVFKYENFVFFIRIHFNRYDAGLIIISSGYSKVRSCDAKIERDT